MKLNPCPKLAYGRSVDPATTIQRLEEILRPHDYWIHEEVVGPYLYWAGLFIDETQFRAMGKGIAALPSRAGAMAEAAEWLACLDTERLPGYTTAFQDDWHDTPLLPIEDLLSHIATATPPVLEQIKRRDAARHWVDAYSLARETTLKVPIEYIRQICGPNGKAAGNTIEEAIEHGILEVFERRAHISVLRHRLVMPTIDSATIDDPVVCEMMAFIRDKGIEIILKDLSFDGVLPCIGAYFHDPNIPQDVQFHHFFKVGSSFNKIEALTRIFTEYCQGRRADEFIDGSPAEQERVLRADFRALPVTDGHEDNFLSAFMFGMVPYAETEYLRAGPVVAFEPGPCYTDSLDDIRHAVRICERLEKECLVVDYTDPAIGFPVAQVIVPGYSDVLPFHPARSPALFKTLNRSEVLNMYG